MSRYHCPWHFILAALATLAATTAFAQSSVQIVGTFDPSIANSAVTYGNDKKVSNTAVRNNSQGTSQITFKGVEDLGGGLKASFLLENDFDTRFDANGPEGVSAAGVRGVNLGSGGGEQYLALEGGFGKVAIGAANTPSLTTQASRQPFSTKIGGGFNGVLGTGHVRSNNSVVYTSPAFSGFTVAAAYGMNHNKFVTPATGAVAQANTNTGASSTNSTNDADQTSISDIGAFYSNGPLSAGISMWNTAQYVNTAGGTVPKVDQTNLFVSYDLGVAKLTAGYHTEKQTAYQTVSATAAANNKLAGVNAQGYNVAAAIPLSANLSLLANYAQLDDKLTQRAAAHLNRKITAVGLKYALSKNTSVYARYVDEKNENITAAVAADFTGGVGTNVNTVKSIQTTLVGMQTNF
jgi:predicted porin